MQVKIEDKIYDAEEEPILVMLDDIDKLNIKSMEVGDDLYCCHPEDMLDEEVDKFIGIKEDENKEGIKK